MVVQETLAYCMVTGEMQGRARLNLDVEGEVIARLECDFNEAAIIGEVVEEKVLLKELVSIKAIPILKFQKLSLPPAGEGLTTSKVYKMYLNSPFF